MVLCAGSPDRVTAQNPGRAGFVAKVRVPPNSDGVRGRIDRIALIYAFVLFATMILVSAIAEAQDQTGTTLPPLLIPLEPQETFPPSVTQGGYPFNLRPLVFDFRQTLADHGIYIIARNLSYEIATVSGGVKRGLLFQGFTQLGFDLEMEHIAGITGGAVHFLLDDLAGQPFYAWSGSVDPEQPPFRRRGTCVPRERVVL